MTKKIYIFNILGKKEDRYLIVRKEEIRSNDFCPQENQTFVKQQYSKTSTSEHLLIMNTVKSDAAT